MLRPNASHNPELSRLMSRVLSLRELTRLPNAGAAYRTLVSALHVPASTRSHYRTFAHSHLLARPIANQTPSNVASAAA